MDLQLHRYFPWVGSRPTKETSSTVKAPITLTEENNNFGCDFWNWNMFSFLPWAVIAKDKFQLPTTVNKKLKKFAPASPAQYPNIRFRPYVSKVPWHTGPRGFLSQLFPRYGHYCGPNWSSGKDSGSPIWDKRPTDWLDFCCYCHDIGYDSHDQSELLKADLAFLECLERPNMVTNGDPRAAYVYKFMCTSGLRNILIPYRQNLIKLQSGKLFFPIELLNSMKWRGWNLAKA